MQVECILLFGLVFSLASAKPSWFRGGSVEFDWFDSNSSGAAELAHRLALWRRAHGRALALVMLPLCGGGGGGFKKLFLDFA